MSPLATIVLVEAASSRLSDLLTAVNRASCIVQSTGTGQVSMSWGSSEFSSEGAYDSYFNAAGVAYFAAAGDSGGKTLWPGVSPNVISAGGTRIIRDSSSGNFVNESAWSEEQCRSGPCGGGGGPSLYEPRPPYQYVISGMGSRGTPDFSFDADPYSGVSVYDSISCGLFRQKGKVGSDRVNTQVTVCNLDSAASCTRRLFR